MPRPLPAAALVLLLASTTPLGCSVVGTRVRATGLRDSVEVTTDRWGIPHVRARSLDDMYFAWGWVCARDRLWQMVYTRAAADGQTHRWLGNAALQADGGAQLFRLRERASAIWQRDRADAGLRMALERYAAGVNAYLGECRRGERAWPAELTRLRERPRDWSGEDCVAMMLGFGITLDFDLAELGEARAVADSGATWYAKRRRFEDRWMYDTVPDSAARRMWPAGFAAEPVNARTTGRDGSTGGIPSVGAPGARAARSLVARGAGLSSRLLEEGDRLLAAFPPHDAEGASRASNEFVVGADRSASGKPVLANDPHLSLGNPSPFHVLHVSVPGVVEAIGADVPGLPILVSGRNERAAWGVTGLSADVIDIYADTLSEDGRRVRTHPGDGSAGWASVEARPYSMGYRVLGVSIPVLPFMNVRRYTPHGPVLVWDPKRRIALAARWTAMETARITLRRLVGLERSASAAEVCERTATLVTPCLNIVAADVDGDSRYQATGLLPVRARLPEPGPIPSDGLHEWLGFVPTEHMPHWQVPAAGYAVNGNNRPVGTSYPWELPRYDWAHDRARRIAQRLEGDGRITLRDAASVQNDVYSLAAGRNLPRLIECADSLLASLPSRSRAALDTLRAWDYKARRSRIAPTLYRAWFGAFQRRSRLEGTAGLAVAALENRAPEALRAPGSTGQLERPAAAASEALAMAIDTLTTRLGPDMATWHYGRAHVARFKHPLAALDTRSRWEPPLTPEDGDNSTPSVGPSRLPWSIEVGHGAAFRHVVDLARPGVSFGVVPPWNSAAFPATGERELRRVWADHAYVPFLTDWSRIAAVAMEKVNLAP